MRALLDLRWRVRRAVVMATIRVKARLQRATVDLDLAPDVKIGARFQVTVFPGTRNRVVMQHGVQLQEDVFVNLRGGTLLMGPGSSVRRGSVLNLSGELELVGNNIISYYNVIHCADRIRLDQYASTNEFVTIVDSRHFHTDDGEFFYNNVETAPIAIGRNVWLANKSSVTMGVTIGDDAIVAGHAMVNDDVPAKALVGGIPARVIRQR